jgi:hypothetical protein
MYLEHGRISPFSDYCETRAGEEMYGLSLVVSWYALDDDVESSALLLC